MSTGEAGLQGESRGDIQEKKIICWPSPGCVDQWTFGFDQLRNRAVECTPERVAESTWVPPHLIRDSARMYATNWPAVLMLGSSTDIRDSMLGLPEKASPEQRKKQLGSDRFKLLGWLGCEIGESLGSTASGSRTPTCSMTLIRSMRSQGAGLRGHCCVRYTGNERGSVTRPALPESTTTTHERKRHGW
jgi:hypothetical protein